MNSKNDNNSSSSSNTSSSHHYNIHHSSHLHNHSHHNNNNSHLNHSNNNNYYNNNNNNNNNGNNLGHHHHNGSISSSAPSLNGLANSNGLNAKMFANNLSNNNNSNLLGHLQSSSAMLQPQQQILMNSPSVNMAAIAAYGQQPALLNNALNGGGNNGNNGNSNNGMNMNNSNSNNGNNNGNNNYHEDSFLAQKLMQIQSIPWFEVEIKGMVKNLSPKLWQWTHLRCLYLNDNNLLRLPPVVSSLVNLQCLDASNNKIRTLPSEIGDMTSLRELYLNNNQIRVLPFELGKLFKLQQLGLKGNPLAQDMMQIYMEPNGTQKLLINLLDQLTITCPAPSRRPWMLVAEPKPNTCIFTTMCYNVLCDKYATRQYYGYCPAWALTWDYRKKLILDDIKTYDADVIALQELETEQFYQFFLPELKQLDYDGIFSPKSRAKTMSEQDKKHVDGCAIFFKTTRFSLVKDYLIEFNQIAMATAEGSEDMLNRVMTKDNIGLAALLEVKQDNDETGGSQMTTTATITGNTQNKSPTSKDPQQDSASSSSSSSSSSSTSSSSSASASSQSQSVVATSTTTTTSTTINNKQLLLICTAHIHWDPDYCDVKLVQTLMFTNEIKLIIEQAMREFRPHLVTPNQPIDCSTNIPVVICADLNSLPDSGVIEYLRTGRIQANHIDFKELGYDACLQRINTSDRPTELAHNLKLDTAYDKDIMPYTNYTYDFKGMIDYIFYSRKIMRTLGFLGPLDNEWIKANRIVGFPHPHIASDHLPLIVELELFGGVGSNNNNNSGSSSNTPSSMNMHQHQQHSSNNYSSSNSFRQGGGNQHNHHNSHHHSVGSSMHNNNTNGSSLHHGNSSSSSMNNNNNSGSSGSSMLGQMLSLNNGNEMMKNNSYQSSSNYKQLIG